jgi:hypothetical protein
MDCGKALESKIVSMVGALLKDKSGELEFEVRLGCFTCVGFDPNIPHTHFAVVESFLDLMRNQGGFVYRKFFTLKGTYDNGYRMIAGDNATDFKDTVFQKKTVVVNADFECPKRGEVGLRLSLSREEGVEVAHTQLKNFIPRKIVLRNRQEFVEVVRVYKGADELVYFEVKFHVTKVSPPQQNKFECTKEICTYQIEMELGDVNNCSGIEDEVVSELIGRALVDRCKVLANINLRETSGCFIFHREKRGV